MITAPVSGMRSRERLILLLGVLLAALPLLVLAGLLGGVLLQALRPGAGGLASLWAAMAASAASSTLAALLAVPLGVGAAVYVEEYSQEDRLTTLLETNIAFLSGVPPILYGLVGAAVLVQDLGGVGAGWMGVALLALVGVPLVLTATRQALHRVPVAQREGAMALGATRLRVLAAVVLPAALPHILSGVLRAAAVALGEAAPLVLLAGLLQPVWGTLPLSAQLFAWAGQPGPAAARAALLLLAGVVVLWSAAWGIERAARAGGAAA